MRADSIFILEINFVFEMTDFFINESQLESRVERKNERLETKNKRSESERTNEQTKSESTKRSYVGVMKRAMNSFRGV